MGNADRGDLEPYPTDHVYAVIDDTQGLHAAVDALFAAGHDSDEVTILCGADTSCTTTGSGRSRGSLHRSRDEHCT